MIHVLKLALFAAVWLIGVSVWRALKPRLGADSPAFRHARLACVALLSGLFWYAEIVLIVTNWRTVGLWSGIALLCLIPVLGFIVYLRWAHARARAADGQDRR